MSEASDIRAGDWIDRYVPAGLRPYCRLARLDRPIGTWLLLFPCWWSLSLALPRGIGPDLKLLALFALGALVMRGGMIFLGSALIMKYQWILIVFGAFLVLTAIKMALIKSHDDPSKNWAVRLCRRFLPFVDFYDGQKFFTKRTLPPTYSPDPKTGKLVQDPPPPGSLRAAWAITPLFLALLIVEITDLVFAVEPLEAVAECPKNTNERIGQNVRWSE
jgi:hypothetical protein